MRRLFIAAVAAASLLAIGSFVERAQAAPVVTLPLHAQSSAPLQTVGCWCGPYRWVCRSTGFDQQHFAPAVLLVVRVS